MVVPRVEGEEAEASASWGTSLHQQGPPGMKSGQEQGPPYELGPQEKIQGTAPGRKRAHTIVLSDPETYAKPKALGEPHAPAHYEPPPGQEGTDESNPKEKILNTTHWVKGNSRIVF